MIFTWKELRPNFSKIQSGVLEGGTFTTFIIDSLVIKQLWTKTIRLMGQGGLTLSRVPNF